MLYTFIFILEDFVLSTLHRAFLVYYATVEQDKVGTDNISSIFVSRTEMALAMLILSVLKSVTDKALVAKVFPMSPIVVKVVSPATGHTVFVSGYYGS